MPAPTGRDARDRRVERARDSPILESRHVDGAAGHRQHADAIGFVRRRCCRRRRDSIASSGICTTRRPPERAAQPGNYPISATPHDTPREPRGPWALPGQYTVRLTVGGKAYSQLLTIRMDPRVKTPLAALAQEHAMAVSLFDGIASDSAAVAQRAQRARSVARRARTKRERRVAERRDRRRRRQHCRHRRSGWRRRTTRWRRRSRRRRRCGPNARVDQRRAANPHVAARGCRRRADDAGRGSGSKRARESVAARCALDGDSVFGASRVEPQAPCRETGRDSNPQMSCAVPIRKVIEMIV